MLKITTQSGAVYLYDPDGGWVQRISGEMNEQMSTENGVWMNRKADYPPEVGQRARFSDGSGQCRLTTPVVSIEEVV